MLIDEQNKINNKQKNKEKIRNKVKSISRIMKIFKTLREENESVVQLKGICADGKVPKGLLLEGRRAIESEIVDRSGFFNNAKKLDAMNEAMPFSKNSTEMGSEEGSGLKLPSSS